MTHRITALALAAGLGMALAAPAFAADSVGSSQAPTQMNSQPQAPERVSSKAHSASYNAAAVPNSTDPHDPFDGTNYNTP